MDLPFRGDNAGAAEVGMLHGEGTGI
jgi:hypothetical protein